MVFYIASLAALGVDGNNVFGFGFETYHYGATEGFTGRCASNSICRRRRQRPIGGRLPQGSAN
jgi:hypothetical protein